MKKTIISTNDQTIVTPTPIVLRETARFNLGREINDGFDEWETAQLKRIQEALDHALWEFVEQNCNSRGDQKKLAYRLYPFINDEGHLSKILSPSGMDNRHVNLQILAASQYAGILDFKKVVDKLMTR